MAKVKSVKEVKDEPLEKQLWKSADKLRKNIDAAEYKHVVLGLIFLKYISDSFEELFAKLQSGEGEYEGADTEDRDEYKSENVFFVPPEARWSFLLAKAKHPTIGTTIDAAMDAIESEKFVAEHQGRINDISIYGQESNQTTWRLAKMNLVIRGIDSSQVKWNNEGSFLNDMHKDLKADFIIANPPFNDSDWSGELLRNDGRWQYGTPPAGNANYAWLQHFIYHLSPTGKAGVVLSKGALTSKSSGEGDIRKNLIADGNLIECIVNLPAKLFLNTQIPAGLWFMNRARGLPSPIGGRRAGGEGGHPRKDEILFIDARNLGHLINRRTRELSHDDIQKIAKTYHAWRTGEGEYQDIKGFCASTPLDRVKELDTVLTPGRYVGLPDEEDDFDFAERFDALKAEFAAQLEEENTLNQAIRENLEKIIV